MVTATPLIGATRRKTCGMFSKQETPYATAAPIRVKCVAKYTSTRAESFEVVDGVVAMKSSRSLLPEEIAFLPFYCCIQNFNGGCIFSSGCNVPPRRLPTLKVM
ncbi:hypothetical protein MHYP_G00310210 [Metynnis hypsauchen]